MTLDVAKHTRFLKHCIAMLPSDYESMESSRMTLVYFVLQSADVLGILDSLLKEEDKSRIIEWIYSLQLPDSVPEGRGGFRGSNECCPTFGSESAAQEVGQHDFGHITMTYTALAVLKMLGDDLSRVHREPIIQGMRHLQRRDGSMAPTVGDLETDVRFTYSACAVCALLDDWSGVDVDAMSQFIMGTINFSGGFGQGNGEESHGGSTYCAVAALSLIGSLGRCLPVGPVRDRLVRWCAMRLATGSGFHGRVNKPADACYSFWIGAALKILDPAIFKKLELEDWKAFVLRCQHSMYGGIGKHPDTHPDVLHTVMGLQGLALAGQYDLRDIKPELGLVLERLREY